MQFVRTTRQTLIDRLKDPKDNNAWDEFYQFYWEIITNWAIQAGCSQTQAQDIFQNTMLCLLRIMPDFEYNPEMGSFKAYLKSIVKSRIYDYFRKEGKYISFSDNSKDDHFFDKINGQHNNNDTADCEQDKIWLRSVLRQALRQAYKKIDQTTYKSFCLYVLEGHPVEEVSRRLNNIRPGTIYQQKSRFLKLVAAEFAALIDSFESGQNNSFSNSSSFLKAIEELIIDQPNYRETMIHTERNIADFHYVEQIRQAFNLTENPCPADPAILVVNNSNLRKSSWYKLKDKQTIGKSKKCLISLEDDNISGLHASIENDGVNFFIKDENSANGLAVNNIAVTGKVQIHDGDIIRFSDRFYALVNIIN